MKHLNRNRTVVRFLPWLRKQALIMFVKYDSGICEVDDVVQEGMIAAIKSADAGVFEPFSFLHVKDRMRDFLREPTRRKMKCERFFEKETADVYDIDVKDAVKKLDGKEKAVIIMYYYQGLNLEEIGAALGFSFSYAARLKKQALRRLHAILS